MKNNEDIEQKIKSTITALEKKRKRVKRNTIIANIIFTVVGLAIAAYILIIIPDLKKNFHLWYLLGFGFLYLIYLVHKFSFKKLESEFKEKVVGEIVKKINPNLNYSPEEYIAKDIFKEANIFRKTVRSYDGEDLIYGQIGDTAFQLSEVTAFTSLQKDDTEPFFTGLFIEADFHKHFHSETYVKPESFIPIEALNKKKWGSAKLTYLEDPEFEEYFRVFTTDEQDARYILSPTMMKSILKLSKKFGAEVSISFRGSKIYIGIDTLNMNLLNDHTSNPMEAERTYNFVVHEVKFILSVIDDLQLNTRIWSKQPGLTDQDLTDKDQQKLDLRDINDKSLEPLEREDDELEL